MSTRPAPKLTRLRVADPYLRFWLRFVEPGLEEIERGRGDLAVERVEQGWPSYRGVAVEPIVRAALDRLLPDPRLGATHRIGAYWTRSNDVEVDIVGAAQGRSLDRIAMVGSIKWHEDAPFDRADLGALLRAREHVPGADSATLVVAVSRTSVAVSGVDAALGPADVVAAWRR